MSLLAGFLPQITSKVQEWIEQQREIHRRNARELTEQECAEMAAYFSAETLAAARVKTVEQIEDPPFLEGLLKQAAFFGIRVKFDFREASGITFVDTVVARERDFGRQLLFHELAHVEQYRQLGTERFTRAYVKGMVDGNFVYESIPLEKAAREMTERFVSGDRFTVSQETAAWLGERGY